MGWLVSELTILKGRRVLGGFWREERRGRGRDERGEKGREGVWVRRRRKEGKIGFI